MHCVLIRTNTVIHNKHRFGLPFQAVVGLSIFSSYTNCIEDTKSHGVILVSMVAWWSAKKYNVQIILITALMIDFKSQGFYKHD